MTLMFNIIKESELRAFWPTGAPIRDLSAKWQCSDAYVSIMAKRLGLPSRRPRSLDITKFAALMEGRTYFENEAARRGLTVRKLETIVMSIVVNDRMVDAILDDADSFRAVA